ncbi:hypothetical protein ACGFZK_02805 [Streptomyces sp. NPDC048257]|uniref:hypothetical protein n=1 Tax=Streptomyces sp. NPDC048257 TaxID=3365526 RepID=UPI003716DC2C
MAEPTFPARTPQDLDERIAGEFGERPLRPHGRLEASGEYAYSSDLWAQNSPYGVRGAGEPPTISATPAGVNAIRDPH